MLTKNDQTLLDAQAWCVNNRHAKPSVALLSSLWKYLTIIPPYKLAKSTLDELAVDFVNTVIKVNGRMGDLLFTSNGVSSWQNIAHLFEALATQDILTLNEEESVKSIVDLDNTMPFRAYIEAEAEKQIKEIK